MEPMSTAMENEFTVSSVISNMLLMKKIPTMDTMGWRTKKNIRIMVPMTRSCFSLRALPERVAVEPEDPEALRGVQDGPRRQPEDGGEAGGHLARDLLGDEAGHEGLRQPPLQEAVGDGRHLAQPLPVQHVGDEREAAQAADDAVEAAPEASDDTGHGVAPPAGAVLRPGAEVVHDTDDQRGDADGAGRRGERELRAEHGRVRRGHALLFRPIREVPAADAQGADCEHAVFEVCRGDEKQEGAGAGEKLRRQAQLRDGAVRPQLQRVPHAGGGQQEAGAVAHRQELDPSVAMTTDLVSFNAWHATRTAATAMW
eukprot:CAMPEP_0179361562 /NCGR_PEP_ID=MMETSP0797-20121207/80565_1 /TAXON_ID=47934 /ORGANISM="Dinophysis acuminata, Strain DAEP01" /LENGTH=312 /DNA_ID=CAMNT_0021076969 /DNA_START=623 /DNA_END=1559 /DNA_ORIENTATION=+